MVKVYHIVHLPLFTTAKVCTQCQIEKPFDDFGPNKWGKYGFKADCRECANKRSKKYRLIHKQETLAYPIPDIKTCRECRIEKPLEEFPISPSCRDGHQTRCKTCTAESIKKYESRRYNPERSMKWRNANRQYTNEYYVEHKEYYANKNKKWDMLNREKRRAIKARRRSIQLGATVGEVNYERIIEQYGMICHICNQSIESNDLTFDHVIPLVPKKGTDRLPGTHTQDNLKPAHRSCNSSKGNRLLEELESYQRKGPR